MQVGICDEQSTLVEALAFVLERRGDLVVATTSGIAAAVLEASRVHADVWVVGSDTISGSNFQQVRELCSRSPRARLVLLVDDESRLCQADVDELGAAAVAEKRQHISDLLRLLDRVHAGERINNTSAFRHRSRAVQPHQLERRHVAELLTPREQAVLCALARGEDTQRIARSLAITSATARSHVHSVITKLGARNRLGAVTRGVRIGLLDARTATWLGGGTLGPTTLGPSRDQDAVPERATPA
jgi:DNA-binding NarL/FixJ family response regulator